MGFINLKIEKMKDKFLLPLAGIGTGGAAGGVGAYFNKDVENSKRNLIEASILGSLIGGGVGTGAAYIKYLKSNPQSLNSIKNAPDIKNTDHLEDIPVK